MRDCNVPLTSDSDTTIKDKIFSICEYKLYNWLQKPYVVMFGAVQNNVFPQLTFFLAARPRLFVNLLLLSMEVALRRGDLPLFPPSGFSIHHELFPVPSFWTRMKRLCKDRLCLIEFWQREREKEKERTEWERENLSIDVSLQTCNHPINIIACFYPIKKDVNT